MLLQKLTPMTVDVVHPVRLEPVPEVSFERLLWFVDRHAENVVRGDLAAVLADCGGVGRAEIVRELRSLPQPIHSVVVEKVVLGALGYAVRLRYYGRGQALVLSTIWGADDQGRLQIIAARLRALPSAPPETIS